MPSIQQTMSQLWKAQSFCQIIQALSQTAEPELRDDNVLFIVIKQGQTEVKSDECFSTLNVKGTPIQFKIDTGSQANIIPVSKFQSFHCKPVVKRSTTKLTSYSGEELWVKGQCTLNCQGHELQFFAVDTDQEPVLSFRASQDLGIIKVVLNVSKPSESYVKQYLNVFTRLGCLSKPYHIQLNPSVQPVVTPFINQPACSPERQVKRNIRWDGKDKGDQKSWSTDWMGRFIGNSGKTKNKETR